MTKIINFLIMVFIIPITFIVYSIYSPQEVPEENLTIYSNRDEVIYEYQDKVALTMPCSDDDIDTLCLRTDKSAVSWINCGTTILKGKFEKIGWYDDTLFIFYDSVYYVFDIDEYEIPPLDEEGNLQEPDYELKEYSESEFKENYPEYESFDWTETG